MFDLFVDGVLFAITNPHCAETVYIDLIYLDLQGNGSAMFGYIRGLGYAIERRMELHD